MLEDIIKQRIQENLKQFTEKEQQIVLEHLEIMKKIYLLGMLDSK